MDHRTGAHRSRRDLADAGRSPVPGQPTSAPPRGLGRRTRRARARGHRKRSDPPCVPLPRRIRSSSRPSVSRRSRPSRFSSEVPHARPPRRGLPACSSRRRGPSPGAPPPVRLSSGTAPVAFPFALAGHAIHEPREPASTLTVVGTVPAAPLLGSATAPSAPRCSRTGRRWRSSFSRRCRSGSRRPPGGVSCRSCRTRTSDRRCAAAAVRWLRRSIRAGAGEFPAPVRATAALTTAT